MQQDELAEILARNGFMPGTDVDFVDKRGTIVELKARIGGVRDLTAAIMRLAELVRRKGVHAACLVVVDHKLPGAIERVWVKSLELLRPELASKLHLLALSDGNVTVVPDDASLRRLGQAMSHVVPEPRSKPYPAFFDVLHVLLSRWLLKQGAIQMIELGRLTGFTQPTLREALDRFGPELDRDSRRRVQLASFPRGLWDEMLAFAPATIRESFHFSDQSGRPRGPDQLLERLARQRPAHVAVGGVVAARFWDAQFDLHGIPRIDLAFQGTRAAAFEVVERLDAALAPHPGAHGGSVVLHRLRRKTSLFEVQGQGELTYCDPVDTLLDLEELRLRQQAGDLIRRLRGGRP